MLALSLPGPLSDNGARSVRMWAYVPASILSARWQWTSTASRGTARRGVTTWRRRPRASLIVRCVEPINRDRGCGGVSLLPLDFRFPIRRQRLPRGSHVHEHGLFLGGSGTGLPSSDIRWRAGGSLRLFSSGLSTQHARRLVGSGCARQKPRESGRARGPEYQPDQHPMGQIAGERPGLAGVESVRPVGGRTDFLS
jgi:hypothetical protein